MSFEPRLHKNKLTFDFMIKNNYHKADTIYEILSFLKLKKKLHDKVQLIAQSHLWY